jgi:L-threonylcarbamoyladenylate synthase
VLRPGGVAVEDIERALGRAVPVREDTAVRVPGQLASHYAPRAGVVLSETGEACMRAEQLQREGRRVALIAPRALKVPEGITRFDVPPEAEGFARELYRRLREIDAGGFEVIVAVLPPEHGLGLAVRDRLRRAAAPRADSADGS